MNEQIKEIMGDATLYADSYFAHDCAAWRKIYNEKFAELIVKECAELTLDYKNDQHYQGWLDYRDEIKRHFGVEE
jgi:hypothetical protein